MMIISCYSVDWNRFSSHVVSGGGDNSIVLCHIKESNSSDRGVISREYRIEDAHDGDINCVQWNPSPTLSHLLVSTGDDGLVKLWKLEF
jgi:cytosolic iron-sulfur protein assembly protein CIAO1